MNLISTFKRFSSGAISKRERYLFYGVITLVVIFIFQQFIFRNIILQLNSLNRKIAVLQINYQKAKTLVANEDTIKRAAGGYKQYLQSELSGQKNPLSSILSQIESLARESGSTLVDMKPAQQESQTSAYATYTIDIGLQGNLVQLLNFISGLQKSNILIEIQKATLVPKEDQLQLKAKLSVVVF